MTDYSAPTPQRPPLRSASSAATGSQNRSSQLRKPSLPLQTSSRPCRRSSATETAIERLNAPTATESPAKRQKLDTRQGAVKQAAQEGETSVAEESRNVTAQESSPSDDSSAASTGIPPFPPRPKLYRPEIEQKSDPSDTPRPPIKETLQSKPYALEAPKTAPQFPVGVTADFWPWRGSGNHPEDALTEQTIKAGNQDKINSSQNETGSARPLIWSSVKHRSGLQILSSLFTSALDQRQDNGVVTAKSTFKPPPRVTLTDNKREGWLRDLADPSIPLRRLSRTIPHGIRGKVLLDHCLSKDIPTWRAVWLAKCVGANEIRAFKRKGTSGAFASGGETKWIRDWTTCLQQFIEGLVESCGIADWKSKISYGLQLLAHLYGDHLLDKDMFLDWIVGMLHNADESNVPIWILVTQMFWKDIPIYRRRGRNLATALCEQVFKMHNSGPVTANLLLWQKLWDLTKTFALSDPQCFVMPVHWPKYASTMRYCAKQEDSAVLSRLSLIFSRNDRLVRDAKRLRSATSLTSRQKLISALDQSSVEFKFSSLSKTCLELVADRDLLVTTAIEWSATPFRTSPPRTYIVIRLLRQWATVGIDLERPIKALIASKPAIQRLEKNRVCKVIAGLVRSGQFSVGKYLQWLMAKGCLSSLHENEALRTFGIEVLENVPLTGLPEHVLNLCNIVLAQAGSNFSRDVSHRALESSKQYCLDRLPCLNAVMRPSRQSITGYTLAGLAGSVKLDLSRWLRQSIVTLVSKFEDEIDLKTGEDRSSTPFTLKDLESLNSIYVELDDFAIYADVLRITIDYSNPALLSRIAEEIIERYEIFYAMGAARDMLQSLLERLVQVPFRTLAERPIFASLLEFTERFQDLKLTAVRLRKELAACEPTSSLAACSPVSDQMAEALQNADSSFLEEVELLFKSGTSMDRPLLSRIFGDIAKRVESAWSDQDQSVLAFVDMLVRLRSFDAEAFDSLIIAWLGKVLISKSRPELSVILLPLICSGAVKLRDVVARSVSQMKETPSQESLAIDFLDLLTDSRQNPGSSSATKMYRFEMGKKELLLHCQDLVTFLILKVIASCPKSHEGIGSRAALVLSRPRFPLLILDTFINSSLVPSAELKALFSAMSSSDVVLQALDVAIGLPADKADPVHAIRCLVKVVDDYNIILCQSRLVSFFNRENTAGTEDVQANDLVAVLVGEASSTFRVCTGTWHKLLSELPQPQTTKFHAIAMGSLLNALPDLTDEVSLSGESGRMDDRSEALQNLLAAIDFLEPGLAIDGASSVLGEIAARLATLQNCTSQQSSNGPRELISLSRPVHLKRSYAWLSTLLKLLAIHQRFLYNPKCAQTTLMRLAIPSSLLLTNARFHPPAQLSVLLYDTIALIADTLTPDTRLQVCKMLREQFHVFDASLDFLLGLSEQYDPSGLDLVVPDKSALGAGKIGMGALAGIAGPVKTVPYPLKRWEMLQDATPLVGENDACLSLTLFGARKAVM